MYNVATVNWLMKATGANIPMKKLLPFHPSDMLCYTEETANRFHRKYDCYSDSYTKPVTPDELKSILNAMHEKVNQIHLERDNFIFVFSLQTIEHLNRTEINQLEIELAGDKAKPKNIFRLATGLFYRSDKCAKRMELAEEIFKLRGGKVKMDIEQQLSHVFVDPETFDADEFVAAFATSKDAMKNFRVVSFEWIIRCFDSGKKCSAKAFHFAL